MTGLIYKEWRQNRLYIILTAVCGAAAVFIPIPLILPGGDGLQALAGERGMIVRVVALLLGFLGVGALQSLALRGDERKGWGVFIASSPETEKGFLRIKYEMIFAMSVVTMSACLFFEQLLGAIVFDVTGKELTDISGVYMTLVFLQLLLRAIDLPFIIRFGDKRGGMIKMIAIVLLFIALTVVIMINPDDMVVKLANWIESGFDGDIVPFVIGIFPFAAIGAYFLSYRISCRIYMKGAEQYDK